MFYKDTDRLIKYFSDTFDICEFVTYEQCHPEDMFGKVMCANLKTRSSPLLGVHVYPDTQSQMYATYINYINLIFLQR